MHNQHAKPARAAAGRCWLLAGLVAGMVGLGSCGGGGGGGAAPGAPTPDAQVRAEAVVLTGQQTARLRHLPAAIHAVYGYADTGEQINYRIGTDWAIDGQGIARTAGSRLPDFGQHHVDSAADGRFDFSAAPRNPPLTLSYQVYVDYQTQRTDTTLQPAAGARRDNRVLCLGDSIAAGAHTVASYFSGSDADSWCGLLRAHLGATAQVLNPSVPGGTLAAALPGLPALLAAGPQTLVLAFGMNDHVQGAAALPAFEAALHGAVQLAQAAGVRVILLGFMQQNTAWRQEDPLQTEAYNLAISRVAQARGVVFIDVRRPMERSAPDGNPIASRTGDFMHHPNNFGHRVHFSLLLPHFLTMPVQASSVPAFVDPAE